MNGTFGGKKGRPATSSEFLRAIRIGVETGANASYETNLKKKRKGLESSTSVLDRRISANIVGAFINTAEVVNPYAPPGLTFSFTQSLAGNGLPVGQTWSGAASSSDGAILFVCSLEGYVYRSADSGVTWALYQYTPGTQYTSISISFDGTSRVKVNPYPATDALTTGDGKYIATVNQNGSNCDLTIARLDPAPTIFAARVFTGASTGSIVGNQDGSYFAASANNGDIYTLSDITTNVFTLRSASLPAGTPWTNIAMSTDLTNRLAVCSSTGLIYTSPDGGVTWVARTAGLPSGTPWINITMSADGTKLAVCSTTGRIYTSTDSGANWLPQVNGIPQGATWKTIRYNSDGSKLIVVSTNGIVCTLRSNPELPAGRIIPTTWSAASNSDGRLLAICSNDATGKIYTSTDFGATWVQRTSGLPANVGWASIASTPDGAILFVVSSQGYTYQSTNSGVSWSIVGTQSSTSAYNCVALTAAGVQFLVADNYIGVSCGKDNLSYATLSTNGLNGAAGSGCFAYVQYRANTIVGFTTGPGFSIGTATSGFIAENSNGTYYALCVNTGQIYTSSSISGSTWVLRTTGLPTNAPWECITMNADGSRIAVCSSTGLVYTSSDSGASWSPQTIGLPAGVTWNSIAFDSNGTNLVLTSIGGIVYTARAI